MCVFCDDREREEVWQILSRLGVKVKAWVYDREVMEKWQPGGLNLERWLTAHGVADEEAERIREDARQKYHERFLKRPNDICLGWEQ
jgi:hypothetical protein